MIAGESEGQQPTRVGRLAKEEPEDGVFAPDCGTIKDENARDFGLWRFRFGFYPSFFILRFYGDLWTFVVSLWTPRCPANFTFWEGSEAPESGFRPAARQA